MNNKTMEAALLPCPFCGHSASLEPRPGTTGATWIVRCDARFLPNEFNELCPVNGRTRGDSDRATAINNWNTRAATREWTPTIQKAIRLIAESDDPNMECLEAMGDLMNLLPLDDQPDLGD